MRQSTTFDEIKDKIKVSGVCKKCGKKRSRTVSEFQTLNPFNKNENGSIKSVSEIRRELRISILKQSKKLLENFICATCYSELPWREK